MKDLKKLFLNHCKNKELEIENNQINIIKIINKFYQESFNKSFLFNLFSSKITKNGFYLYGDVGVGKTMLLNFFYLIVNAVLYFLALFCRRSRMGCKPGQA